MSTTKIGLVDKRGIATGEHILVDEENYEALSKFEWSLDKSGKPYRRKNRDGRQVRVMISRDIYGLTEGSKQKVFYKDTSNYLDCRKKNLELTTRSRGNTTKITPTGKAWPVTGRSFLNYAINYLNDVKPDEFHRKFKALPSDLLELVELAENIKWNFRNITLRYQKNSPIWEKATTAPTSTLIERFLKDQFEWGGGVAAAICLVSDPYLTPEEQASVRVLAAEEKKLKAEEKNLQDDAALKALALKRAEEEAKENERKVAAELRLEEAKIEADLRLEQAKLDAALKLEEAKVAAEYAKVERMKAKVDEQELTFEKLMVTDMALLIKAVKKRGAVEVRF